MNRLVSVKAPVGDWPEFALAKLSLALAELWITLGELPCSESSATIAGVGVATM